MIAHRPTAPARNTQSGIMILEALIAILIFSFGILAIVALQAVSVKLAGDAKYRSDASMLAEELLAEMWTSDRVPANMSALFATGADACTAQTAGVAAAATACAACTADPYSTACQSYPTYTTWFGYRSPPAATDPLPDRRTVAHSLPGTATNPPTVVVDTSAGATSGTVTVTVRWQAPNDGTPHAHTVTAQIR
jgi:type IV pilus assembly protein PilV